MDKTNNEMPTFKRESVTADAHPAEIEAERLRAELADERAKTDALARRCIRLGEALDAALKVEDDRTESDMFSIINGNHEHRKAVAAAEKRRRAAEKKEIAALERSCKRNAVFLTASAVFGFTAAILGFAGLIHAAIASVLGCAFAIAFGWALNDCVYLLGRCK